MSTKGHSVKALLAQHPKLMGMTYVALLYLGGSEGGFLIESVASTRAGP